jgi:flavin-dependent dehydrogenase
VTLIEATREGWWYSAPLPGERLLVARLSDHAGCAARRWVAWSRGYGSAPHTAARTGRHLPPQLRTASARSVASCEAMGDGWLAVGDAADARDPLSGTGICDALHDGIRAAQTVAMALDGDSAAVPRRRAVLAQERVRYREARRHVYGLERRWSAAPFWRARR